jgi:hypothetical protein
METNGSLVSDMVVLLVVDARLGNQNVMPRTALPVIAESVAPHIP